MLKSLSVASRSDVIFVSVRALENLIVTVPLPVTPHEARAPVRVVALTKQRPGDIYAT